ncbi:MAG: hypothetical protein IPO91_24325 [Chloroflexi bacterium]|nr:hypothetical protein [Chloroflexota bacterium]
MNANQQYRLDQLHRDDVMRATRRQRLLNQAVSQRPQSKRLSRAAIVTLLTSLFR